MKQRLQVETGSAQPPAGCGRWVLLSHADGGARPNPPEIRPNFCTPGVGGCQNPRRGGSQTLVHAKRRLRADVKLFFKRVSGYFSAVAAFKGRLLPAFGVISSAARRSGAGSFALFLSPAPPHAEGRRPWSFPQTQSLFLLRASTGCAAWGSAPPAAPLGRVPWGCSGAGQCTGRERRHGGGCKFFQLVVGRCLVMMTEQCFRSEIQPAARLRHLENAIVVCFSEYLLQMQ